MFSPGTRIDYNPVLIDTDPVVKGAVVKMFEPAGSIFNQPMLVIDEIPHWIPARECTHSKEIPNED